MDLIYRKHEYKESLKRLRRIRSGKDDEANTDQEEKNTELLEELDGLIVSLRTDTSLNDTKIHYILLICPIAIISIWLAITQPATMVTQLYLLFGLLLYIWIAHRIMRGNIDQYSIRPDESGASPYNVSYLSMKLKYLEGGVVIQRKRLILLVLFYLLFFPILLLLIQQVGMGGGPFDHTIWNIVLAYIVAVPLWYWYFSSGFDHFEELEESLEIIREQLLPNL